MYVARGEVSRYMRERNLPEDVRDDLIGVAFEALVKAARSWKPGGRAFPSWASFKVRGALFDEARRRGPVTRSGVTRLSEVQVGDEALANIAELPADPDGNLLAGMLDGLSARGRYIIERRYIDDLTLEEIAAEFGVTASRVLQLEKTALDELRARVADPKTWLLTRRGPLTPKMVEVLQLCADGYSLEESARKRGTSETAIKDMRRRAQKRLSARNVYNAVAIALRRGLID